MKFFVTIIFLLQSIISIAATKGYQVVEFGNNIMLNSPYGTRVFLGDIGFDKLNHYQLEVNIADLRQLIQGEPNSQSNGHGDAKNSLNNKDKLQLEDEMLTLKANELYNQGKFTDSLGFVNEILRRNTANIRGWIMKGSLLHVMGQKDLAKKAWQEAQKLEPDNPEIKSILENY